MYIEELRILQVKCFEDLHIHFRDESGEPRRWTVLVGENGTGKSTVLQTIGLSLNSGDGAQELMYACREPFVRVNGYPAAEVKATVLSGPGDGPPGGLAASTVISWERYRDTRSRVHELSDPVDALDRAIREGYGCYAGGYGPTRRLQTGESQAESHSANYVERMLTLFDENAALRPISSWLQAADYQSKGGVDKRAKDRGERRLALMKQAIASVVQDVERPEDIEVGPDGVFFQTPMGKLPASALSDGNRGMLAWVVDMLGYLSAAFPHAESLLECEGVVLVDEVDAHLHPSWQREVIPTLRSTFPNMQFIVTTHSPLTVQGARDGEVVVLKRDGDKVVAETGFEAMQGWRADQVLTSDVFGLPSTRSPETQALLEEQERLLSVRKRTPQDEERLSELTNALRAQLPLPGDTPAERAAQSRQAELLKVLEKQVSPEEIAAAREAIASELGACTRSRKGGKSK